MYFISEGAVQVVLPGHRPIRLGPGDVFGDARRNSIEGPGTIVFNMALNKVFQLKEGVNLEFRINAANVFNTPQYSGIDTVVDSPTFGQVTSVSAMRTVTLSGRFRF